MTTQHPARRTEDRAKAEQANWIFKARLSVLCFSFFIVLLGTQAPERSVRLHPDDNTHFFLFSDKSKGEGQSTVNWINEAGHKFECNLKSGAVHVYCGISLKFATDTPMSPTNQARRSVNLAQFDTLKLKLDYHGNATKLRVFLREMIDAQDPGRFAADDNQKYQFVELETDSLQDAITIDLAEFRVADWWMELYNKTRDIGKPSFRHIVEIGIDLPANSPLGQHQLALRSLEAVGPWNRPKDLYFWVLVFLLCWISIESALSILNSRRNSRSMTESLHKLQKENEAMEQEAYLDPVSGAHNQASLERIRNLLFGTQLRKHLMLYLIRVDHFKRMQDTLGTKTADSLLKKLTEALKQDKRTVDHLIRWEGEIFVYLAPFTSEHPSAVAERLRHNIAQNTFQIPDTHQKLKITISLGYTRVLNNETFETAFDRAETALKETWKNGGNCSAEL